MGPFQTTAKAEKILRNHQLIHNISSPRNYNHVISPLLKDIYKLYAYIPCSFVRVCATWNGFSSYVRNINEELSTPIEERWVEEYIRRLAHFWNITARYKYPTGYPV